MRFSTAVDLGIHVLKTGTSLITIPAGAEASGYIVVFANPPGLHTLGTVTNAIVGFTSAPSTSNAAYVAQPLIFSDQLSINVSRSPNNRTVSTDLTPAFLPLTEPGLLGWDGLTPPTNTTSPVYGGAESCSVFWVIFGTTP